MSCKAEGYIVCTLGERLRDLAEWPMIADGMDTREI